jgi:NitT/TauT family transport system permease protein
MLRATAPSIAVKRPRVFRWLRAGWSARHRWAPPAILSLLLLALWEAAIVITQISPLTLPRPWDIITASLVKAPLFARHFPITGLEVVLGFLIATALGSALGVVIASSRLLGSALYPILVATQVMPKIAIAPLLIIWFGFGIPSKLVLTALIAFFPIVINTIVGLNMTRQQDIYLFRSMGASQWQTFWKLRLPNALPVFFGGLKVAATLAVIGAVVGEFTGANSGLGYLLMVQVGHLETAAAFASVVYLTLLGLLVFFIVSLVERLLVPAHMLRRFDTQG